MELKSDMAKNGKYMFGSVRVGDKGQIVIPKEARDIFNIKPGDSLTCLGDVKQGIALIKSEIFLQIIEQYMNGTELKDMEE